MANSTADGSVVIDVDMNVSQAEKNLAKLRGDIEKAEGKLSEKRKGRIPLAEELEKATNAAGKASLEIEKMKTELLEAQAGVKGGFETPFEKFEEYQKKIKELPEKIAQAEKEYEKLNVQNQKAVNKINEFDAIIGASEQKIENMKSSAGVLTQQIDNVNKAQSNLAVSAEMTGQNMKTQTTEAGVLTQQIDSANISQIGFAGSVDMAGQAVDRLKKRVIGLAKRVFVFSVITMALRAIRNLMVKYVKSNDKARAAIAQLKGALLTLAQPLMEVVIPAFTAFVNLLAKVVTYIAKVVSSLFGKTLKQSQDGAKALYDQAEAYGAVGDAAKDAGKSVASFDEINQIGGNEDAKSGGGTSTIAPDFSGEIADTATSLLTDLGLLVIGALLTFTGANILLGIGMMALGAYGIYKEITENPLAVKAALDGWIGDVLVVAGFSALVIGTLLAFSGFNIPLGIFLIGIGAAALYGEATLAPDKMGELLDGWIGDMIALVGLTALVAGAVLAFSGVAIPLGIGLMLLGAASIATEATLAPDAMREKLNGWLGDILALVGVVALVIGVVLAFSAVNIPLGIALIVLGAGSLITESVLAPDKMKEMLNGWLGEVITVVGIVALVIGVVLAFSAINIPLGVALIVLGAGAIIAESVLSPDKMKEMLSGWLGTALIIVGIVAIVLGIILIVSGVGIPLGIALLVLGVGGLFTGIAAKWNIILEKLKGMWSAISNWWNSTIVPALEAIKNIFADRIFNPLMTMVENFINFFINGINSLISKLNSFGFDLPEVLGGGRIGFNIPKLSPVQLPRLAQGAVIPPNREFMAVLGDQKSGTNIETPLATMVQAFKQAMAESGRGGSHTVILQLDRMEFGRAVYEANNEETQRIGVNFAGVRT